MVRVRVRVRVRVTRSISISHGVGSQRGPQSAQSEPIGQKL